MPANHARMPGPIVPSRDTEEFVYGRIARRFLKAPWPGRRCHNALCGCLCPRPSVICTRTVKSWMQARLSRTAQALRSTRCHLDRGRGLRWGITDEQQAEGKVLPVLPGRNPPLPAVLHRPPGGAVRLGARPHPAGTHPRRACTAHHRLSRAVQQSPQPSPGQAPCYRRPDGQSTLLCGRS